VAFDEHDGRRQYAGREAVDAGRRLAATASATSTAIAMPGPNACRNPTRATTSDALPSATVSPAARTIGRSSRSVRSAAATRGCPSRSSRRCRARKKIE
jgi:hypothetical protein